MKKFFYVMFFLIFAITQVLPQDNDINIGQIVKLNSYVLEEERNILISLPLTYNTSQNKYPVFVILDGETHFNYTVGVIQFLSRNGLIPELIVVGIPNTDRNRDFTPIKDENVSGLGGADNFLKFMDQELFPYIEKNYRVENYKILAGHSLCGMFAFYTLLTKPEMFDSYFGLSPWVIASNNYIVGYASETFPKYSSMNKFVYFTAGSLEQEDLLTTMNSFIDILKTKAPKDLKWEYKLLENEDHGTLVMPTIYDGLKKLYKDYRLPDNIRQNGLTAILDHYKKLSGSFNYNIDPPEGILNLTGYFFFGRQQMEEAINIFKKNIELYPKSPNVYDSLGELYENLQQLKLANENYEKAFHLAQEKNHPFLNTYKLNFDRTQQQLNKSN